MSRLIKPKGFSASYGELEEMLAKLSQTSRDQIRVRFRKLRLRPFPDDIRTGTGVPVPYDLPRSLAIALTFELNALLFPQGQAVHMVEHAWPEACRAAITAAVSAGILGPQPSIPANAGSLLLLYPDAFGSQDVLAAEAVKPSEIGCGLPTVMLDVRRVVDALIELADDNPEQLGQAFATLSARFGWAGTATSKSPLPARERAKSFLLQGPYLARAEAFLRAPAACFDAAEQLASRTRLQALFDYLLAPAPVDAHYSIVGTEDDEPRLERLIAAVGDSAGLQAVKRYPAVSLAIPPSEARARGLKLIAGARSLAL